MKLRLYHLLLCVLSTHTLNSAIHLNTTQDLKTTLQRTWKYSKCEILQIVYPAEKKEQHDMLQLKPDETYVRIDDGEKTEGVWEYLPEVKMLLLHNHESGEAEKLVVEKLNPAELVLRKSEAWRFDILIYMNATSLR